MAGSWRRRQGLDHAGLYKPYRDFVIYLSQEKLKDFKQGKNDIINLHPSRSFSLLNGEWNAMGQKRRRNPEQLPLS